MSSEKKKEYLARIGMIASKGRFEGTITKKEVRKIILIAFINVLLFAFIILFSAVLNGEQDDVMSVVIIVIVLFSAELLVVSLFVFLLLKSKKAVLVWLDEAIECEGYTTVIDVRKRPFRTMLKLKIEFIINGTKYERETGDSSVLGDDDVMNGYFSGIEQFANKSVRVLYCPNHNKVMILKD